MPPPQAALFESFTHGPSDNGGIDPFACQACTLAVLTHMDVVHARSHTGVVPPPLACPCCCPYTACAVDDDLLDAQSAGVFSQPRGGVLRCPLWWAEVHGASLGVQGQAVRSAYRSSVVDAKERTAGIPLFDDVPKGGSARCWSASVVCGEIIHYGEPRLHLAVSYVRADDGCCGGGCTLRRHRVAIQPFPNLYCLLPWLPTRHCVGCAAIRRGR